MTASRAARLLLACLLLIPSGLVPAPLAQSLPSAAPAQLTLGQPLTVMSFNIRYGTANDGENHWTERRNMLFDVVREQDADLIGLQEAVDFQIDEIVAAAPAYGVVGVGRDDGAAKGEYSAILFRKSRLHVAEAGTFWFSDTPSVPGSRSWGNNITRICTWARFIDRDGRGFYLYNLHLDHQSQPSRERSTLLLRERVESRSVPLEPVVISGDFNVGEDNPALATLTGLAAGQAPFVDTFRVVRPDEQPAGTFTGFKFGNISGAKIDYVLVQPGTEVERAEILRFSRNERYPSDHFPVVARVRLVWGERDEPVTGDR
jgi:endonuclease/exonuclease/phosphatase family metal-dependent hydrolase